MPQEPAADVLAALDGLRAEFDELREASKRPFARLKLAHHDPLTCDMPDFNAVRTLCQLLSLRASAELALRRADGAFADIRVIHRLADVNRTEPSVNSAVFIAPFTASRSRHFGKAGWPGNGPINSSKSFNRDLRPWTCWLFLTTPCAANGLALTPWSKP